MLKTVQTQLSYTNVTHAFMLTQVFDFIQVFSCVSIELLWNAFAEWDSIGHMSLVAALEETIGVMLDTDDIIELSSMNIARETLDNYYVNF